MAAATKLHGCFSVLAAFEQAFRHAILVNPLFPETSFRKHQQERRAISMATFDLSFFSGGDTNLVFMPK